jgi:hypothetical protein
MDIDIEDDEDFRWLSSNFRPWPSVLDAWTRTRPTRMSIVKGVRTAKLQSETVQNAGITDIPSYLKYFRPLSTSDGWTLVSFLHQLSRSETYLSHLSISDLLWFVLLQLCADFDEIHPQRYMTLVKEWNRVVAFARSKLGVNKRKFLDDDKLTAGTT